MMMSRAPLGSMSDGLGTIANRRRCAVVALPTGHETMADDEVALHCLLQSIAGRRMVACVFFRTPLDDETHAAITDGVMAAVHARPGAVGTPTEWGMLSGGGPSLASLVSLASLGGRFGLLFDSFWSRFGSISPIKFM